MNKNKGALLLAIFCSSSVLAQNNHSDVSKSQSGVAPTEQTVKFDPEIEKLIQKEDDRTNLWIKINEAENAKPAELCKKVKLDPKLQAEAKALLSEVVEKQAALQALSEQLGRQPIDVPGMKESLSLTAIGGLVMALAIIRAKSEKPQDLRISTNLMYLGAATSTLGLLGIEVSAVERDKLEEHVSKASDELAQARTKLEALRAKIIKCRALST